MTLSQLGAEHRKKCLTWSFFDRDGILSMLAPQSGQVSIPVVLDVRGSDRVVFAALDRRLVFWAWDTFRVSDRADFGGTSDSVLAN